MNEEGLAKEALPMICELRNCPCVCTAGFATIPERSRGCSLGFIGMTSTEGSSREVDDGIGSSRDDAAKGGAKVAEGGGIA